MRAGDQVAILRGINRSHFGTILEIHEGEVKVQVYGQIRTVWVGEEDIAQISW